MSGSHHPDTSTHDSGSHPVRLAIVVTLGAIALIIGIILMAQLAIGFYGSRSREGDPAMSEAAVEKRIAPVAQVAIDPNAPAPKPAEASVPAAAVPAPAIPPPATKAASAGGDGKAVYDASCTVCHGAGVAGAPKLGDKAAWAPRLKAGTDALYASALKGKGAMPPKGGNASLSDAAVKAAVDHMLASVK